MNLPSIIELSTSDAIGVAFDLGIWAAGFEERSRWLISSRFKPPRVKEWYRVEFLEHRDAHSSEMAIARSVGKLVGDGPANASDDGHWLLVWRRLLRERHAQYGRQLRLFVDYLDAPYRVWDLVGRMHARLQILDRLDHVGVRAWVTRLERGRLACR